MIKLVTLDFDDTLITIGKRFYKNTKERCKRLGIEMPSEKKFKQAWSLPWKEFYKKLFNGLDEREFWDAMRFNHYRNSDLVNDYPIIMGFLRKENILVGVLTSSTEERINKAFNKIDGIDYNHFDFFYTLEDCENPKPHPDSFYPVLDFADCCGIEENEILYVGDGLSDLKTAKNAKVHFAAVTSGIYDEEDFKKAGLHEHKIYNRLGYTVNYIRNVEWLEKAKMGIKNIRV
ncbi:MAG: HAD-IA family hydrolase [Nanoarchaeota archaeon]|nr:HAD-IA family hydrolase [Nanoarchaeota archaeon]MBU1135646.1 HAD-IA family hydrolase [Nanoarchaeota archaeon]MBU2520011.1 HAD-IA family hydrolase [Nanoarchaeota archaeon]